ncbi:1-acylglycerol-3-phosphate O-acyltransferase [Thalassolituus hydrocarboniclasticus]|uniref:1-acyl-sn-glycerol-3-phosphate acyltransferase n=1 Tax=Thalassolituus hydrocarboniclasticus TaxID=2742796 RepID=A0ABY6AEU7_9GAMM|nr:1-acylglycerol-3-phosphate O-acyltransferase [Thalassolituus hydrocarboniclasticus]UXD89088.1 1-acylglycerol-3-phosphate O-acyltransferase [Thalassolituus hydrocarboniclasticus]
MLFAFRAVVLTSYFLFGCILGLMLCIVRPFHRNNTRDCAKIFSLGRWLLNIKMTALNQSPVGDGQAIYVGNHQDTLDVFIYPGMLPGNIAILGKSSLRFIPVFGLLFWLAGNIFINRANKAKAWETMAAVARTVKKRGCAVYIFPEGTRSRGKGLLPFKSGAFALAIEAGLPVVPVVYSSTHKNINLHRFRSGKVLSRYLEPISTEGMGEGDVKRLAEMTRERMQQAIDELDVKLAAK